MTEAFSSDDELMAAARRKLATRDDAETVRAALRLVATGRGASATA